MNVSTQKPWDIQKLRCIFDRSPTLRAIPDEALQDPHKLADALIKLRAIISGEVGKQGKGGTTYALVSLVNALAAGGRLKKDLQTYQRMLGARDLYDRSPLLQSLSDEIIGAPMLLAKELVRLRPAITEEQRNVRSVSSKSLPSYSLATMMKALIMSGRIKGDEFTYTKVAGALDLYERSPILQGISNNICSSPVRLVTELSRLRQAIVEEQRAARNVSEDELADYSLNTLVNALVAAGRIAGNTQLFNRMAGSRNLYDRSPILQGISSDKLRTPQHALETLMKLRPRVVAEQRTDLTLNVLVHALIAGGKISPVDQAYERLAYGHELYNRSVILQGISDENLSTPLFTADVLHRLRPAIIEEQRRVRQLSSDEPLTYALSTLVQALDAAGRIEGNAQRFIRMANAHDLYERSPIIQGIPDSALSTPHDVLNILEALRPTIVEEQRLVKGVSDDKLPDYALSTLSLALVAGGRIREDITNQLYFVSSRDLYNRSPILQGISDEILRSPPLLIDKLVHLRSAIVDEQRNARGVSAEVLPTYSLATLIKALTAGGKLTEQTAAIYAYMATARDLYDRSPILKGIADDDLATNEKIVEKLIELRPAIIQEQRTVRKLPADAPLTYALATLVGALDAGGRLSGPAQAVSRLAHSRDQYERSAVLQKILNRAFESPRMLLETVISQRPAYIEELGKPCSLANMVSRLCASGKVKLNVIHCTRLASARDLYDNSSVLQGVSDAELASPERLTQVLMRLRPAIVDEQRMRKGIPPDTPLHYSIATLILALTAGNRISDDVLYTYTRYAASYNLYINSPILQGSDDAALSSPKKLMRELVRLRPAIIDEQKDRKDMADEEEVDYALNTLIHALTTGGRLTGDIQSYLRMGGARDLYDRSPILQGIPDRDLETPGRLANALTDLRQAITEEQRAARGLPPDKLTHYALSTLTRALDAGDRLDGDLQLYLRYVNGRESYDLSLLLQGIDKRTLSNPRTLMAKLIELREAISEELHQARGRDGDAAVLSLSTFIQALIAGDKISSLHQEYLRLVSGYEFYQRSPILQAISDTALATPILLLKELIALKPQIIEEQRKARGVTDESLSDYALGTFVSALDAAGRLEGAAQRYERILGSYDLYDRSPTLKSIPEDVAQDDATLMTFLLTYRDRIALENLKAFERVDADAFISPDVHEHYALTTLVESLYAAGIIDEKRLGNVYRGTAGPLEYYMKRRQRIESEIRGDDSINHRKNSVDRSRFTALRNPEHVLSRNYIGRIIKWGRWFMESNDIAFRSIYRADELAFMTLFSFRDVIEYFSPGAATKLEAAGHRAEQEPAKSRNEAVAALNDVVKEYNHRLAHGERFNDTITYAACQMHRLVRWNYDAVRGMAFTPITTLSGIMR